MNLFKQKHSPYYTWRTWIFKCIQLYIYVVGLDLAGAQLAVFSGEINFMYIYYCGVQGFFLGAGFYRVLEIYWYGKDLVTDSLNTVTENNIVMQALGGE
jgi:hypothetical protein